MITLRHVAAWIAALVLLIVPVVAVADDLPSWNDGAAKRNIIEFVTAVTTVGGPDHVEPADRVAVFDNDGTLWGEQPMYVQLAFALHRIKVLAPSHPEWKETEPFRSVLAGDLAGVAASGEKGLVDLVGVTHAGWGTSEEPQGWFPRIHVAHRTPSGKQHLPVVDICSWSKLAATARAQEQYRQHPRPSRRACRLQRCGGLCRMGRQGASH